MAVGPVLSSPPRLPSAKPTLDPDASLATARADGTDPDRGKLAVGAAGLVAGMALVAGLALLGAGAWWWSTQVALRAAAASATEATAPADAAGPEMSPEPASTSIEPDTNLPGAPPEGVNQPPVGTPAIGTRKPTAPLTLPAPAAPVTGSSPAPNTATPDAADGNRLVPDAATPNPPAPAETLPPEPLPVAPTVATPALPTKSLNFVADSIGWTVYLDDVRIGKTPLSGWVVPYGQHQVRLVLDGNSAQRSFEVSATTAATFKYTSAKNIWTWHP